MSTLGVPELLLISLVCGVIVLIVILVVRLIVRSAGKRSDSPIAGSIVTPAPDNSATGKLKELNRLLESGLITQAEYDEKKAEIIKQL